MDFRRHPTPTVNRRRGRHDEEWARDTVWAVVAVILFLLMLTLIPNP